MTAKSVPATVYTLGLRLDGKGACVAIRPVAFLENSFNLVRHVYAQCTQLGLMPG